MKILGKKFLLSLLASTLLASSLSAVALPQSFFALSKEKQKEILMDDEKMQAYLAENGISKEKDKELETKVLKEAPKAKFDYMAGPVMEVEEAKKEHIVPQNYDGPMSFKLELITGQTVDVSVGFGNGGNLIVPKKMKVKIKDAKLKFPNGKIEHVEPITIFIEESESEIISLEVENYMNRKDMKTEDRSVTIPVALIKGVLYMDINKDKGLAIDLSHSDAISNIDTSTMISKTKIELDLKDATVSVKEK